jgi:hypothetical protein
LNIVLSWISRLFVSLILYLVGIKALKKIFFQFLSDLIDPALLRPGRIDKALLCSMPDKVSTLVSTQCKIIFNKSWICKEYSRSRPRPRRLSRQLSKHWESWSSCLSQFQVYVVTKSWEISCESVLRLLGQHAKKFSKISKCWESQSQALPRLTLNS